ncbi:DUF6183 family protein [Streptomyces stramineus]
MRLRGRRGLRHRLDPRRLLRHADRPARGGPGGPADAAHGRAVRAPGRRHRARPGGRHLPAEAGNWGDSAAWVFRPDEAVAPEQVPALLPTLPMACVEGLGPTGRFEIAVRPLDAVWRLLFATASLGGLYASGGYGGAYARLAAWHSMAALSGAPAGASAAEAEQYARQSTWFHFESDAAWFHNEIYDYGIAALSPDRRRIAVLAATDTD